MYEPTTSRIRIDLAYDGTPYHGWAKQPNLATVQGFIEDALAMIFRQDISVTVAGRTDAGVHATRQVIHCDVPTDRWQALVGKQTLREPGGALVSKLNGILGKQRGAIHVLDAQLAPADFDARFSPLHRTYRYRIVDGTPNPLTRYFTYQHRKPLDVVLMQAEIQDLHGLYDFGSFCKPRPGATTIRTLLGFYLERHENSLHVLLCADAFCHHMVRALVGALLQVGDGTRPAGWLRGRLAEPVRDSNMMLAPAHGLTLEHVEYPSDEVLAHRASTTRAKRDPTCLSCD